ncbi:MAG: protein-L-isoaspartate O-methyltransferase [Candidatus Wolfebacteria bacterium]|nr:protein-L-isoaspartate O-methyltransferase [Candidatus Wolfebacteria bacterium]
MAAEYENLINSLIKDGFLVRPEITEAFRAIDRADFVPDEFKAEAYLNVPLSIGFEQTISQPLTVAFMIELLEPKIGEKILEIGSGSGWQTAILSRIVSHNGASALGKIIGLERVDELKEFAEKNIGKYGFIGKEVAKIIKSDGSKGFKEEAPFDRIIAGAASKGDVPEIWKKQLKIGGRIVAPVNQSVFVIDKIGKNKYNKKEYFGFSFVPLVKG